MKRLKQLRDKKGFTQIKMAHELGITQAAISKYESGKGYPDISILIHIADYLDVSVDYLLERTPFEKTETPQLSENELKCLSLYNGLTTDQKKEALAFMRGLAK